MAGRKSTYEEIILPRIEEIKEWIKQGKTDKYCAEQLGISPRTFSKHKNSISSFSSIIKKEREPCVRNIENSMYESALGFVKTLRKPIKVKKVMQDGKKKVEEEKIEYCEEEIYIPPNITAQIFLLKNWGDYVNEPKMIEIRKEELEIKRTSSENKDW